VVTTVVAVAVIWRYLFHTRYGTVNWALSLVGIDPIDWLGDPHWSMPTIILFAVWKNFGYNMIIFLAGLQAIPEDLYEAARIDGASWWKQLTHVTLPMLGPVSVARVHPDDGRLLPVVRRALRDHAGRAAAEHRERAVHDVRRGLQVVEPRQRIGGGVPVVPADDGDDERPAVVRAASGAWNEAQSARARAGQRRADRLAAISLAPLFWMLAVSFMQPGEASHFPPPWWPSHPTLHNYRELFLRNGMATYLFNSALIATGVTLISVLLNTLAGTRSPSYGSAAANARSAPCSPRSSSGAGSR
jgi:hypothetical protein